MQEAGGRRQEAAMQEAEGCYAGGRSQNEVSKST